MTVRCLYCDDPVPVFENGAYCSDCDVYADRYDDGRWKVYIPALLVPTSDWVDCPWCDGTGHNECESP